MQKNRYRTQVFTDSAGLCRIMLGAGNSFQVGGSMSGTFLSLLAVGFIGGTLGYLSMRYQAAETLPQKLKSAVLSITMGMFAAWIVYVLAIHMFRLHTNVGLALGGLAACGGGDMIITLYRRLKKQITGGKGDIDK